LNSLPHNCFVLGFFFFDRVSQFAILLPALLLIRPD
jgi:hypothetical protein